MSPQKFFVEVGFTEHPKVKALERLLHIDNHVAVSIVVRLWALGKRCVGKLYGIDAHDLAAELQHPNARALVDALRAAGLLDGPGTYSEPYVVHDYDQHQKDDCEYRRRAAERRAAFRSRKENDAAWKKAEAERKRRARAAKKSAGSPMLPLDSSHQRDVRNVTDAPQPVADVITSATGAPDGPRPHGSRVRHVTDAPRSNGRKPGVRVNGTAASAETSNSVRHVTDAQTIQMCVRNVTDAPDKKDVPLTAEPLSRVRTGARARAHARDTAPQPLDTGKPTAPPFPAGDEYRHRLPLWQSMSAAWREAKGEDPPWLTQPEPWRRLFKAADVDVMTDEDVMLDWTAYLSSDQHPRHPLNLFARAIEQRAADGLAPRAADARTRKPKPGRAPSTAMEEARRDVGRRYREANPDLDALFDE